MGQNNSVEGTWRDGKMLDFSSMSPEVRKRVVKELQAERDALRKELNRIKVVQLQRRVESLSVENKYLQSEKSRLTQELSQSSEEVIRESIRSILKERKEEEKLSEREFSASPTYEASSQVLVDSKPPVFYSDYYRNTDVVSLSEEEDLVESKVRRAVEYLIRSK